MGPDSLFSNLQSKILAVVDYVQLYTLLALPMVPSGAEEQPLRRWRRLIGVDKIEADGIKVGLSLPQPQLQMVPFEYS